MRIIQIEPLPNGAHRNQTTSAKTPPDGWAVIPPEMTIPSTFPFVGIEVEAGVVVSMIAGVVPEPEPEPEPEPTTEERVTALEAENEALKSQLAAVEAQMSASVAVSNSAFVCLAEQGGIAPAVMAEHVDVFAAWAYPVNYKVGNIRQYSGKLYKCLQDHTSQEAWTPDTAPSLWVAVSDPAEEWPEWVQPVASTDAYPQGAKVTHSGKRWTSDVAANVWEPGVYGWTEAE